MHRRGRVNFCLTFLVMLIVGLAFAGALRTVCWGCMAQGLLPLLCSNHAGALRIVGRLQHMQCNVAHLAAVRRSAFLLNHLHIPTCLQPCMCSSRSRG